MNSVGRLCLYCSRPLAIEERVAVCDRCFAAHHEECWERNGRCSTFKCAGVPRTMRGIDMPAVIKSALQESNEQPTACPYCMGKVYPGILQGHRPKAEKEHMAASGLVFVSNRKPDAERGWLGKRVLARMAAVRTWFLPGAHLRARSCGKCKRMFLWGVPVDDAFLQRCQQDAAEHFCPHCSSPLWPGQIPLRGHSPGSARFECDDVPDFHKDWLGHNVLDRLLYSKWDAPVPSLPAHSCPDCLYTEVGGRPIYRFL